MLVVEHPETEFLFLKDVVAHIFPSSNPTVGIEYFLVHAWGSGDHLDSHEFGWTAKITLK